MDIATRSGGMKSGSAMDFVGMFKDQLTAREMRAIQRYHTFLYILVFVLIQLFLSLYYSQFVE